VLHSRFAQCVLGVLLAGSAEAASYYVNDASLVGDLTGVPWCATSVAGSNTAGCGTCAKPCATIAVAFTNNVVGPGDTVYVNSGTYTSASFSDYPHLSANGAVGNPITIRGAADAQLKPLAILNGNFVARSCMWIDSQNMVIRGLECRRTAANAAVPYGSGFYTGGAANNLEFRNLVVHTEISAAVYSAGIETESSGTGSMLVDGCEVFNSSYGVLINSGSLLNTITNNQIHNIGEEGVRFDNNEATSVNVVRNNAFFNNPGTPVFVLGGLANSTTDVSFNTLYNNSTGGACVPAIGLFGTPDATVTNNLIFDNGCDAIRLDCYRVIASTACLTASFPNPSNSKITNNTLHNNLRLQHQSAEINLAHCVGAPPTLKNNIVHATSSNATDALLRVGTECAGVNSNYNDLYQTGSTAMTCWNWDGTACGNTWADLAAYRAGAPGLEANSLSADPLFFDSTNALLTSRNYSVRSRGGYWNGSTWALDPSLDSPTIDIGDPSTPYSNEPFCSGGRVNLGKDGNTAQASKSYNSCQVRFVGAPQSLWPGQCSANTLIQVTEPGGTPIPQFIPLQVSVASSSSSASLHSTAACGAPGVSTVTIQPGQSSAGFFFQDNTPGTPTLTASVPTLVSATQAQTIRRVATQLAIVSAPQTIGAGQCSAAVTVEAQDSGGVPSDVQVDTVVTLAGAANVFTDSCVSVGSAQTMTAGTRTLTFFVRETALGTQTLTASGLGLASQPLIVGPGPAARIDVTGLPSSIPLGMPTSFSVTLRDALGNLTPSYVGTIHFASTDASAQVPADATFATSDLGQKTLGGLVFNAPGTYQLTATDMVQPTVTGSQGPITVTMGLIDTSPVDPLIPPRGPTSYRVGCNCSSGSPMLWPGLMALLLALGARRRV
jgi:uncharacterized protein (TIGR03382 family)